MTNEGEVDLSLKIKLNTVETPENKMLKKTTKISISKTIIKDLGRKP